MSIYDNKNEKYASFWNVYNAAGKGVTPEMLNAGLSKAQLSAAPEEADNFAFTEPYNKTQILEQNAQETLKTVQIPEENMQYEEIDDVKSLNEAARIAINYNAERIRKGQEMADALGISSKLVMHNMETYQKAEEMYGFMQRMKLPSNNELEKYFPGIGKIAQNNPALAAEAFVNIENVKVAHGIAESFSTGWSAGTLQRERSLIGTKAFEGRLTATDKVRLKELEEQMRNEKQAPQLGDSFVDAMMYGVASNANMLANWAFNEITGLLTVGGAVIGGAVKQEPTEKLLAAGSAIATNIARGALSKAGVAGAAAGMQAGTATSMFRERVGDYYLSFLEYQDSNGNQLLSDNEARLYAALSAGLEAGIEFLNIGTWAKLLGGAQNKAALEIIKEMIAGSRDTTSFRLLAKTMLEKLQQGAKATWEEILEEGVQQGTSDIITNIAAARNPGGNIPSYGAVEIFARGAESMIEALPASAGFTVAGAGASSFRGVNNIANAVFRAGTIRASVQRTAKANNCINELAENPQVQEFIKNNPQAAEATIGAQLEENGIGTAYIDTELLNQTDDGKKVFNQLVDALGYSEEEITSIKGTNTNLALPTRKLLLLDGQTRASLQDYISFKEADACFKRNKEIVEAIMKTQAESAQRDIERIEQGVDAAVNENFADEEERFYAKDIILNNINLKPAEALAEERRQVLAELDGILVPVEDMLRSGMGNGVEIIIQRDETGELIGDNSMRDIRASNNAPWYQDWWKDNGRRPNKAELRDIAIANITAQDTPYLLENYMGMSNMEFEDPDAWQDVLNLRERIDGLRDRLALLDRLQEGMKNISLDDISAGEALSPEGIKAYRSIVAAAKNADAKNTRQAAMMNAMLICHHADTFVELMRHSGYRDYTVADYFKQNPVVLKFGANENATWDSRKIYGQTQVAHSGNTEKAFGQAAMKMKYYDSVAAFDSEIKNTPKSEVSKKGNWVKTSKGDTLVIPAANYLHVQNGKHPLTEQQWEELLKNIDNAEYAISNGEKGAQQGIVVKIKTQTRLGPAGAMLEFLPSGKVFLTTALYSTDKGIEAWQNKKDKSQTLGIEPQGLQDRKLSNLSLFESIRQKLGIVNKFKQTVSEEMPEFYNQVAYHGSPYVFEHFDLGAIGSGEGAQAHGWGIYFAKNRKVAKFYKEALTDVDGAYKYSGQYYTYDGENPFTEIRGALTNIALVNEKIFSNDMQEREQAKQDALQHHKKLLSQNSRRALSEKEIESIENIDVAKIKLDKRKGGNGSLIEVDIPENKYLLDENKRYKDQLRGVQKLIKDAFNNLSEDGKERFVRKIATKSIGESDATLQAKIALNNINSVYKSFADLNSQLSFIAKSAEATLLKNGYTKEQVETFRNDKEAVQQEAEKYLEEVKAAEKAVTENSYADFKRYKEKEKAYIEDASKLFADNSIADGEAIYAAFAYALTGENYDYAEASKYLNKQGIKGITYEGGRDGRCFVVFDDKAIEIIERYNQSVRGTITINRGVRTIELFKISDQSTFLHEAAHLFFDDLERMYNTAGISKQVRQDWEKLNAWATWNENSLKEYEGSAVYREFKALDEAIRKAKTDGGAEVGGVWLTSDMLLERWKQERFARSFEQYVKEGKAPTKTLRAMFRKFANWLASIYRHYTNIGETPTQEVKEIMDRMLATQEAIDEAVVMADIDAIEKAGGLQYLDSSSRQMWQKIYGEAKDKAYSEVLKYAMRDLREADKAEYQKKLDKQREYITVKLSKLPAYMVQKALKLNPKLTISEAFAAMNTTEAEYKKQIAEYGNSLDTAVAHYMKNYEQELKNESTSRLSLRERAEEAMTNNYYRELLTAYELEVMQRRIKREQNLTKKLAKLSGAEHTLRRKEIEKRAREMALKDAIRDVKDELKRKRIADNAEDRAYIRDILAEHPAYKAAQLLEQNPNMSVADAVAAFDITEEEYIDVMKRLGASVEKAVEKWINNANKVARENFTPDDAQIKAMAVVKLREEEYQLRIADYENELASAPVQTSLDKVVANLDARRKEKAFIERGVRVLRDAAAGQVEAIRKSALKKLDSLPAKYSTNPATWMKLSNEQSQKVIACLAKKDFVGAAKAKQLQLAYDIMAAEAYKNKEKYESFAALLKARSERLRTSKDLGAEERYLYGHLLYVFGTNNKDLLLPKVENYQNAYEVLEAFKKNHEKVLNGVLVDENGGWMLPANLLDALFDKTQVDGGIKSLTMPEIKELKKFMAAIYKLGRERGKLRTLKDADGKPLDLETELAVMAKQISRNKEKGNSDTTGAQTLSDIEKAMESADKFNVSLVKIETTLTLAGKRFVEIIYDPIKRALDNEANMQLELQEHQKEMWDRYWQAKGGNIDKAQAKFYGERQYRLGTSRLTHENIVVLALNWGTELNRKRIIDGYNVSERVVVEVLQNLDEADWNLVQDIWATFDIYWPQLRDVQERTTGIVMEKQEAVQFSILDKTGKVHTLLGGYYPIKYNTRLSTQLANFEQNETARMNSGDFNTRSGIGMSSTKARVEGNVGNKKVLLDLSMMNRTLSENIHTIALRETLRDVNQIVNNEAFQNLIRVYFGANTIHGINKWLADCWASDPRSKSGTETLGARLRKGSTTAALAFNVSVPILNLCNFFPCLHYMGGIRMFSALLSFYWPPTTAAKRYNFAMEKSAFLKTRENNIDTNAFIEAGKANKLKPIREFVNKWGYALAGITDKMFMIPLWVAEYQQAYQDLMQENILAAIEDGERAARLKELGISEEEFDKANPRKNKHRSIEEIDLAAIDAGDRAVRKVFGSSRKLDLAEVQRSQSEFDKTFTMFYSYFSVVHNASVLALGEYSQRRKRSQNLDGSSVAKFAKDVAPLMSCILFWYMLPAATELIIRNMRDASNEDKEVKDYSLEYLSILFGQMVGGVPILRDALPLLLSVATGTDNYGMRNTSISEWVSSIYRLGTAIASDKKDGFDIAKQAARVANPVIGLPRLITDGFVTTLEFIDHGEMSPEDLQHYVWSVMFAKDFDKNR